MKRCDERTTQRFGRIVCGGWKGTLHTNIAMVSALSITGVAELFRQQSVVWIKRTKGLMHGKRNTDISNLNETGTGIFVLLMIAGSKN